MQLLRPKSFNPSSIIISITRFELNDLISKSCTFTNTQCNDLGYPGRYSNNPGFKRQRSPPLQPGPVDFTLDTICGGPHLAEDSNKARERYAETLRHEREC